MLVYRKPIEIQWNNFLITFNKFKISFEYEVLVSSNKLGMTELCKSRSERLELMLLLQEKYQMNCVEISDFLNSNNIKTPRNKIYNYKIVWSSIKKCKNRLDRFNNDKIIDVRERIFIEEL